jgi:predicted small lipoprotein YifL
MKNALKLAAVTLLATSLIACGKKNEPVAPVEPTVTVT